MLKIILPAKSSSGFSHQKNACLFCGRVPQRAGVYCPPPTMEKGKLRHGCEAPQKLCTRILIHSSLQPSPDLFLHTGRGLTSPGTPSRPGALGQDPGVTDVALALPLGSQTEQVAPLLPNHPVAPPPKGKAGWGGGLQDAAPSPQQQTPLRAGRQSWGSGNSCQTHLAQAKETPPWPHGKHQVCTKLGRTSASLGGSDCSHPGRLVNGSDQRQDGSWTPKH